MSIPLTLFMWIIALFPIMALLILMMKFNCSAPRAATAVIVITTFTGIVVYKADFKLLLVEGKRSLEYNNYYSHYMDSAFSVSGW